MYVLFCNNNSNIFGNKSTSFSSIPKIIIFGLRSRYMLKNCWSDNFKLFQNCMTTGQEVKMWHIVSTDVSQNTQVEVLLIQI